MFETGADPAAIVEQGPEADLGCGALERIAEQIIAANPDQVEKLKAVPRSSAGLSAR